MPAVGGYAIASLAFLKLLIQLYTWDAIATE
jgi:hypothetical protein